MPVEQSRKRGTSLRGVHWDGGTWIAGIRTDGSLSWIYTEHDSWAEAAIGYVKLKDEFGDWPDVEEVMTTAQALVISDSIAAMGSPTR
jgi:hypothetical protein